MREVDVVTEGLSFPEGPVVLPDGALLCVEIQAGRLTRVDLDGTKTVVAELRGGPNGAAIGPDGAAYVCNNGWLGQTEGTPGIQRVDLASGEWSYLYTECDGRPLAGPNDLVFDDSGNFWFTDFVGNRVYYAAPDGSMIQLAVRGINGPNGIGLSPDGSTLYWAQTVTRQVMRRHLSSPGVVVPSPGYSGFALMRGDGSVDPDALVVGLPGGQELDSLAVDSSGAICVGTVVESGITEIPPDGNLDDVVRWVLPDELQDRSVTNIAFGGDDMQTAFITCSATGRIVRFRWPRPGLALAF